MKILWEKKQKKKATTKVLGVCPVYFFGKGQGTICFDKSLYTRTFSDVPSPHLNPQSPSLYSDFPDGTEDA